MACEFVKYGLQIQFFLLFTSSILAVCDQIVTMPWTLAGKSDLEAEPELATRGRKFLDIKHTERPWGPPCRLPKE